MAKIDLEIITGVFEDPYRCEGTKTESDKALIYEWTEKREPDEAPSAYKLTLLKSSRSITLQRSGAVKSNLRFESGIKTKGHLETGYGTMEVNIDTMFINVPNMFSRTLEISYKLMESDQPAGNKFVIREL